MTSKTKKSATESEPSQGSSSESQKTDEAYLSSNPPNPDPEAFPSTPSSSSSPASSRSSTSSPLTVPLEQLEGERRLWEQEKANLTDSMQRIAADFDNYKKRIAKEASQAKADASRDIIEHLLPVLDNLEMALKHISNTSDQSKKAVELLYAELAAVLEKHGLSVIDANGKPFDPRFHEALLSQPANGGKPKNSVDEVLQKGYLLYGNLIRTAKVKIAV